ncbi:hypothetical protein B0A81_20655 [Flavobacterium plurextorum]|uniref:Uncharacterized protein n=1 Tax=Flavobacterium plurextorum TaxID=1114867 RepID=A0ABX4CQ10_9FLAO|nr:hypothetical protein [Flavobacterium plurextorum]OXB00588.1 hypothetical protein B0A81_20655 [Flavobacterium plurextorum]
MEINDIITCILSLIAITISVFTYWDSNYNFKLKTSVGRHSKLYTIIVDNNGKRPAIFLNVSFLNNGGKTETLEDVKLYVTISANGKTILIENFIAEREFTDIFNDNATLTEILPIVVSGKSNTVKKYLFRSETTIDQHHIPFRFDLKFTIHVKQLGKWIEQSTFESKNNSNVWQDLTLTTSNSSIINLKTIQNEKN